MPNPFVELSKDEVIVKNIEVLKNLEIVKDLKVVEEALKNLKVEVPEKEPEKPPNPYQELVDAQAGRLQSDIPMSDVYWKIKKGMI